MSAKAVVHVPGISEGLIEKKVPISPAKGDISVQTRQCLETVKHEFDIEIECVALP